MIAKINCYAVGSRLGDLLTGAVHLLDIIFACSILSQKVLQLGSHPKPHSTASYRGILIHKELSILKMPDDYSIVCDTVLPAETEACAKVEVSAVSVRKSRVAPSAEVVSKTIPKVWLIPSV